LHNASSVPVPVLCFGLVTSTPVFRRLVCSTPLSSPVFSPLETPKAPKGGDGGRKGGGFKNAGTLRTSAANPPAFPPLQSADSGARRRPWAPDLCSRSSPRTSTSSQGRSLSLSVCSLTRPPRFLSGISRSRASLLVPAAVPAVWSDAAARFWALRRSALLECRCSSLSVRLNRLRLGMGPMA
jgi:hypothetical protein